VTIHRIATTGILQSIIHGNPHIPFVKFLEKIRQLGLAHAAFERPLEKILTVQRNLFLEKKST
jgi:hypothetical protein